MSNPKLALIPSGYKSGKVYSILPNDATGDFDFDRASEGTRVRKDGLIEEVTNDVPRLDWYNSNCPSLLLEPQRTQLAEYNTNITSANGYALTNGTLEENTTIAPDGTLTASTFKATADSGRFQKVKTGGTIGSEYTVSAYVKRKKGTGQVYIRAVEFGNILVTATDEWTRVSATVEATSTNIRYGMALENADEEIYVWGFQVEEATYESSFIYNTATGTVTRLKDECFAEDSNLFNITEGTLFVDATPFKSGGGMEIQISDGTASNRHTIQYQGTGTSVRALTVTGGTTVFSDYNPLTFDIRNKLAITFKEDEFKFYVNGSLVHTDTSGAVPTGLDKLTFSNPNLTGTFMEGKIHDIRIYDTVLTQTEAEELTTL